MSEPYISVVVTARNDDHGGNMLGRMQAFVNAWLGQARRHQLDSELIVVDWNPPGDRPPLMEALRWPSDTSPCEVRFIQVPPELHCRYRHAKALPLYQMIAKNVGIRRARGRFVLVTNIDIIFSSELVKLFAERGLQAGRMYRMDRVDVGADVPIDGTLDEQLDYCQSHVIRLCAREGYFELDSSGLRKLSVDDIAERGSGIAFGDGWFTPEHWGPGEALRCVANDAELILDLPSDPPPPLLLELEPGPGVKFQPFTLQLCDAEGRFISSLEVGSRMTLALALPPGGGERQRFRFRVREGGVTKADDPRIMNFLVHRCRWSNSMRRLGPKQKARLIPYDEREESETAEDKLVTRFPEAAHPHAAANVPAGIARIARFYGDAGGAISALHMYRRYRRRSQDFAEKPQAGQDIFSPDSGIHPGLGWHSLEHYLGETFRWAGGEAELIIRTGATSSPKLGLQVEPGPGVGNKPFELVIRDFKGKAVTSALVEKLRYLEVPLPLKSHRTHVFSISAADGGAAIPNGDPRILDFRVFWCGLRNADPAPTPTVDPGLAIQDSDSVDWGMGWSLPERDETGQAFCSGFSGAEVLVRPQSSETGSLTIEIAPAPGMPSFRLEVRGQDGTVFGAAVVHRRCQMALNLAVVRRRTSVFELHAVAEGERNLKFCVYRLVWSPAVIQSLDAGELVECTEETALADVETTVPPVSDAFLHTNACGDFTMMSREDWLGLRGYPELDMYSFHIDSLFCWAAHHAGVHEEMISDPCRCYHIEHSVGSGWTPEGEGQLFTRLQQRGIDMIQYSDLVRWVADMRRLKSPLILNRGDWGLAGVDLPERSLPSSEND